MLTVWLRDSCSLPASAVFLCASVKAETGKFVANKIHVVTMICCHGSYMIVDKANWFLIFTVDQMLVVPVDHMDMLLVLK